MVTSEKQRWRKQWDLDRHRGLPRYVDPAPVREHVQALVEAGATQRAIALAAGTSQHAVQMVLAGDRKHTQRLTATRLLGVTFSQVMHRDDPMGFVPAVGPRRRIQALMAIGHRHEDITAAMRATAPGVRVKSETLLWHTGDLVQRRTAAAVAGAYNALWSTPGPSDRTRSRARSAGYAPPLAWDDDTIDDPAARPLGVEGGMAARRAALIEDVEELVAQGETVDSACARLGKKRQALERSLYRAGRQDLWARLQGRHATLEASA